MSKPDLSPHYRKMAIEPREYGERNHLTFSETNTVKYVTRHRYKDGAKDLKKAIESLAYLLRLEYNIETSYSFSDDNTAAEPQPSDDAAPSGASAEASPTDGGGDPSDQPSHSVAEVADAPPAPAPKKRGGRTAGTKAKSAAGGKRTAKGTRKSASPTASRRVGCRKKSQPAAADADSVPEWGSEAEAAAVADFRAAGGFAITDDIDPNDPIFRD